MRKYEKALGHFVEVLRALTLPSEQAKHTAGGGQSAQSSPEAVEVRVFD